MDAGQLEDRLKKARAEAPPDQQQPFEVRYGRDGAQRKKSTEPLAEQATASASGEPTDDGAGQAQASNTGAVRLSARSRSARASRPSGSTRPLDKLTRPSAGKRSSTLTDRKRGRYIRARPMHGRPDDLAFDATIRTAAPFQRSRLEERAGTEAGLRRQATGPAEEGARAPRGQSRAVRGRRLVEHGCRRAHRGHQRRGAFAAARCVPAPRPGGADRLPARGGAHRAAAHLQRRTGPAGALRDIPVGGKTPLSAGLLAAFRVCTWPRRGATRRSSR